MFMPRRLVTDVCKQIAFTEYSSEFIDILYPWIIIRVTDFFHTLPVWGPPMRKDQISCLQSLQNQAIQITKSRK